MWKSFRFRNEMLCFSGTLLASSSCKATVRKTWRNEEEVKILHEKASKPDQCKVKLQTCATNAKKLRTSKSCLQHSSQTKTNNMIMENMIQVLTLHLHWPGWSTWRYTAALTQHLHHCHQHQSTHWTHIEECHRVMNTFEEPGKQK